MKKFTNTTYSIISLIIYSSIFSLIIFNVFGALVSGVWLAILGKWNAIFNGAVIAFVSSFLILYALIPGVFLIGLADGFNKKGKPIINAFWGFIVMIYTIFIQSFWFLYVLDKFTQYSDSKSLIPLMIWSYGVAMTPWLYLAQKETHDKNSSSIVITFFAGISYMVAIFMFYFGSSLVNIGILFFTIMLISSSIYTTINFFKIRKNKNL